MAITSYSRISRKGLDTPFSGITVAPSNDHTDGSWVATDCYDREISINVGTGQLQYLAGGIVYNVISFSAGTNQDLPIQFLKVDDQTQINIGNRFLEEYFIQTNFDIDGNGGDLPPFDSNLNKALPDVYDFNFMIISDDGSLAIPYNYNGNYTYLPYDTVLQKWLLGPFINILFRSEAVGNFGSIGSGLWAPRTFSAATLNASFSYITP